MNVLVENLFPVSNLFQLMLLILYPILTCRTWGSLFNLTIIYRSSYSDLRFTAVGSTEGYPLVTNWDSFFTRTIVDLEQGMILDMSL